MSGGTPAEWGLIVPFVLVKSKGGPYEDSAYEMGFEAGSTHRLLTQLPIEVPMVRCLLHTPNLEQIDLIAMACGWKLEARDSGTEGWSYGDFHRTYGLIDETPIAYMEDE